MASETQVEWIDFSQTPLSKSYSTFYAKVLDNLFSEQDCLDLIAFATNANSSSPATSDGQTNSSSDLPPQDAGGWQPAGLSMNAADGSQTVHSNFRNSDRILKIDNAVSQRIYEKIRPHVEEIHEIDSVGSRWAGIVGKIGKKQGPTWRLVGVNPRLSFLKYGPGHYFKPHCDGLVELPSSSDAGGTPTSPAPPQKSFVTIHLYLNEDGEGGATRFWTPDKKHHLDVFPKLGRVLIFQQRMLVHSGEEVTKGLKYTMRSDLMFEQV
ncbi:hypothetical protein AX16_004555 [Volvariella volvacea WC 439]|nr:hypothetical protein AX16_004555 [Volvariella volvacea WC 439]